MASVWAAVFTYFCVVSTALHPLALAWGAFLCCLLFQANVAYCIRSFFLQTRVVRASNSEE